jgi:hypothetical protein
MTVTIGSLDRDELALFEESVRGTDSREWPSPLICGDAAAAQLLSSVPAVVDEIISATIRPLRASGD